MPVSTTISALFSLLVQLVLLVVIILVYVVFKGYTWAPTTGLLALPLVIGLMSVLGLGVGILVSALTTKYRDLAFLVAFGVQLFMYATPVVYPLNSERVQSFAGNFLQWNPMAPILEGVRKGLFNTGMFEWWYFGYACTVSAVLLLIAIVVFNRVERSFIDTV